MNLPFQLAGAAGALTASCLLAAVGLAAALPHGAPPTARGHATEQAPPILLARVTVTATALPSR